MKRYLTLGVLSLTILVMCDKPPETGTIEVRSEPQGADVYLDDNPTDLKTNCCLEDIATGEHTLKLTLEGYADFTKEVSVETGDTHVVVVELNFPDTIDEGTLKWHFPIAQTNGCPAIDPNGTIYIGSQEPYLYAITPEGQEKWRYQTEGSVIPSPVIGPDGTIYCGDYGNGYIHALNPQNGTEKWGFRAFPPGFSTPAIQSNGIILGSAAATIYAIDPEEGSALASYTLTTTMIVVSDGTIYAGTNSHFLYALTYDTSFELQWIYETTDGWISSTAAIDSDGTIYFGSGDNLYALNPDSSLKWKYPAEGRVEGSPVIASDGTIYFGSHDNCLYALYPSGELKWKYQAAGHVQDPAIGTDGIIYVCTADGYIHAIIDGCGVFGPKPILAWRYEVEDPTTPTIGSDGTVYVGGFDGLYAFESTSFGLADSPWPKFHCDVRNTGRAR